MPIVQHNLANRRPATQQRGTNVVPAMYVAAPPCQAGTQLAGPGDIQAGAYRPSGPTPPEPWAATLGRPASSLTQVVAAALREPNAGRTAAPVVAMSPTPPPAPRPSGAAPRDDAREVGTSSAERPCLLGAHVLLQRQATDDESSGSTRTSTSARPRTSVGATPSAEASAADEVASGVYAPTDGVNIPLPYGNVTLPEVIVAGLCAPYVASAAASAVANYNISEPLASLSAQAQKDIFARLGPVWGPVVFTLAGGFAAAVAGAATVRLRRQQQPSAAAADPSSQGDANPVQAQPAPPAWASPETPASKFTVHDDYFDEIPLQPLDGNTHAAYHR